MTSWTLPREVSSCRYPGWANTLSMISPHLCRSAIVSNNGTISTSSWLSDAVHRLAEQSPDRSPQRQDEPYRRAITGIYARLAATAGALTRSEAPRPAVGAAPAYAEATEFLEDLDVLSESLMANGSSALARGRLRLLC